MKSKNKNNRSTLVIFIAYVWTKTLLGLTIRPYKSVREINRNKVLTPVLFSPIIGLIVLFVFGRMATYVLELGDFGRTVMAIVLSTGLISILLWQGLLLYLFFSFRKALRRN
jgi:hypothetical protein